MFFCVTSVVPFAKVRICGVYHRIFSKFPTVSYFKRMKVKIGGRGASFEGFWVGYFQME